MKFVRNYKDFIQVDISYRKDFDEPLIHDSFKIGLEHDPLEVLKSMYMFRAMCDYSVHMKMVHDVTINIVSK